MNRQLSSSPSIFLRLMPVFLISAIVVPTIIVVAVTIEKPVLSARPEASEESGGLKELEIAGPVAAPLSPTATSAVKFDFDGDGSADIGRWQVSSNGLRVRSSSTTNNLDYSVGDYGAKLAPGDFNGDGKTDAAVFKDGEWKYKTSPTASAITISHGATGDIPVAADYDGDGKTDAAIFRPSTNVWSIKRSSDSSVYSTTWGESGDLPVPGDYDGDGLSDFVVWRPSTGLWYLYRTTSGYYTTGWGTPASDIPVPGDFDGDDKTDIAVFRKTTGVWYIRTSGSGFANWVTQAWGNVGDQPVPADYDGDGIDDYAIWRPTTGTWWLVYSGDNYSINTITLGEVVDRAVPAAYIRQVGGAMLNDELAASRLSPRNATGGTDLYSQNFSWGRSLVNLPGRAGLDLSLGISYNSLVWTKSGDEFYFDADRSNAGPGFRLGFPVIEPIYYDGAKAKFAYMMVAPSGARVEFRETAVSQIYETADSSYAQLKTTGASNPNDPVTGITITVTTTDGTQMKYLWEGGADRFVCKEIKDRNGNFITIGYDSDGLLNSVTDTLGRVITIANTDGYPTSITQNWKTNNGSSTTNDPKTWASFTYTSKTINTNYYGLAVVGPLNGHSLKVLDKITYLDQSSTKFTYNDYGQVYKVTNIAADSSTHELNSTLLDLSSPTTSTDVPRFNSTSTTVENFNNGDPVVVTNSSPATASSYSLPGSISINSSVVKVGVTGHPNELYSRIHFGGSGWKEGLVLATEDCIGSVSDTACTTTRKRWTWTDFTQDNTGLSYILNPRVIETQVGDGTNTKRTTVSYRYDSGTSSYLYGLPETIKVYGTDLSTVLKESYTAYNLSSDYTSRRIIGLPSETKLWEGTSSGPLMSKVTYGYDENGYTGTGQSLSNATMHCTSTSTDCPTAYGTGFSYRGNRTSVRRWDVTAPTTESSSVVTTVKYNIAGSPISQTSPWDGTNTRTVSIGYTDSWNDSVSRTTYAYPTSITDPSSQSSMVKYRYDIGTNVEATSPAPAGQTYGKTTKRTYEGFGRLQKDSVYINTSEHSYVRYEYPENGIQSKVYSTINDVDGDGNIAEDEVYSESWFDGSGQVRKSRTEHPGSAGGWSATLVEYDKLGRVTKQSVPTEISVSGDTWTPAGDDYTRGWLWTHQKYDWKNRVIRKINTDGLDQTTYNDSDILISYEGCGCSGGQVTTIESELVPRDDTSGNARRKQKIYEDIIGRSFKTEVFEWNGTTVHTATVQTFNGRDQVTNTRQYAGGVGSSTYQDVTMTYDGHGRMKTRRYPIEDAGAYTDWMYNADDSIQQIIDPRLAITNFTYNSRGLITQVSYSVPNGSTIPVTPTTTFAYDNLGNRTSMDTAGVSETTYFRDSLSRITSETVDFDDLTTNLTIGYTYNIGGGLKSITDPFSSTIDYTNDKTGRVTAVDGTAWATNTTGDYASNIKYRAFGELKQMDYARPDGTQQLKLEFDNRLRINYHSVTQPGSTTNFLMKANFSYFADSRMTAKDDLLDDKWDQTNKYDFAGRLTFNQFGMGPGNGGGMKRVYEQSIGYDGFSNMTTRSGVHWDESIGYAASFTNGRLNGNSNLQYDAAGNVYHSAGGDQWTFSDTVYDAAGRRTGSYDSTKGHMGSHLNWVSQNKTEQQFDGDGRPVVEKRGYRGYPNVNPPSGPLTTSPYLFQIWSTVLGKSLTTVTPAGNKLETNVFAGGAVIAKQGRYVENNTNYDSINWTTVEPVTGGTEPLGQTILASDPATLPDPQYNQAFIGYASDAEWQCTGPTYDSFSAMPFHCQKRMIMDLSYSLADLFGFTQKQNSPIAVVDSPIPSFDFNDSPSENVLAYGRTSTAKPDKKKGTTPKRQKKEDCPKNKDGTYVAPCISAPSIPEDIAHRLFSELGGSDDWGGTQNDEWSLRGRPSLSPQQDTPLHCLPTVIAAMNELWATTAVAFGISETEAGFTVEGKLSVINKAGFTNQFNKLTVRITEYTRAIFHSHPNTKDPEPEGDDQRIADADPFMRTPKKKGEKAPTQKLPVYTFTSRGLYIYDPFEPDKKRRKKLLRDGTDWQKPCP